MNNDNNDIALGILGILAIIFFPFGLIWSLNTLLSTGVEYSFWTWLASAILFFWLRCATQTSVKVK